MGAMTSRIQKAQENTVKNNAQIIATQRELINASDFNSVDEYKAAIKAQREAIEAHNAMIRDLGR